MNETLDLGLPEADAAADPDNVSDWALEQFQAAYGPEITKDDIWEYLYGVMHSPQWRMDYRHDLQRNLPRIPLADDFEASRCSRGSWAVGLRNMPKMPLTRLAKPACSARSASSHA